MLGTIGASNVNSQNFNLEITRHVLPENIFTQPRPQGFSLKKWVGREKALASAGHVSPRTP